MQQKLIFNCIKLCLLIVICTAAPSSDPDSSSDTDGPDRGEIVKLAAQASDPDSSSDTDGPDRGKIVKLAGDENAKNEGAGNEGLSDAEAANGGTINAEEKDEAPVADEAEDVEGDNAVQDNEDPVKADEKDDAPVADEAQESGGVNAVQDNEDPVKADEKEDAPVADEADADNAVQDNEDPGNAGEKDHAPAADEAEADNAVQDNEEPVNADEKDDAPAADEPIDEENKNNELQDDSSDASNEPDPAIGSIGDTYSGFKLSPEEMTKFKIWPEAKIPYYIDELSYDKALRDKIRHYLDEARSLTGLQFEELLEPPELDDNRWVFFVNRRGQLDCKDYNTNSFTIRGVQKVIIGYNCLQHGGPMAAIVLSLAGVPPQHNAPDRDKYIKVDTDHILPEKRGLFKRLKDTDWLFHDIPYDFNSVSHYPLHKYTADGHETIKLTGAQKLKKKSQRSRKAIAIGSSTYPRWLFGDDEDMISLHDEKKTYSGTDLHKISLLYSYIMQNKPQGIKATDCKALYRAGPNFRNMKLTKPAKIPERPKPAKYLSAVKNDNSPEKLLTHPIDVKGELLSELSS